MRTLSALLLVLVSISLHAVAQCAMCKSSVETTDNAAFVAALRDGIYMLLVTPYLIAGAIALGVLFHWRRRRRSSTHTLSLN